MYIWCDPWRSINYECHVSFYILTEYFSKCLTYYSRIHYLIYFFSELVTVILFSKSLLNQATSYCILVKISIGGISLFKSLIHFIGIKKFLILQALRVVFRITFNQTIKSFLPITIRYPVSSKFHLFFGIIIKLSATFCYGFKCSIITSGSCAFGLPAAIGFLLTMNKYSCCSIQSFDQKGPTCDADFVKSTLIRRSKLTLYSIICRRADMLDWSSWIKQSCKAFPWSGASFLLFIFCIVHVDGWQLSRDQSFCIGTENSYAILFRFSFFCFLITVMAWLICFSTFT